MTSDTKEHGEAVTKIPRYHVTQTWSCGCGATSETDPRTFVDHTRLGHHASHAWVELPQGVKHVNEQRLREIMSGYMEFHAPDYFEIRALAYEVRNWRGLAAVSDAALESAASATSGRAASAAKGET